MIVTCVGAASPSVLHVYLSKSSEPTLRDIVKKRKNIPKEIARGKNVMAIWTSHSDLEFI